MQPITENISPAPIWKKYNRPSPRYTSYPTVPCWTDRPDDSAWQASVADAYTRAGTNGVSLYVHLPFCESLCTYCGCNKRITVNHSVEQPYIASVLQEWERYSRLLGEAISLGELHLGGGTPTFFSPEHLCRLIDGLLAGNTVLPNRAFSLEAHPANTTRKHLSVLYDRGFDRLSLGIQDFDPQIQELINRKQTVEQVAGVVRDARDIGYTSINFDLIYGLPGQDRDIITRSIHRTLEFLPERIAFYSYAHVPWKHKGQRRYDESDLPSDLEKHRLYETGRSLFLEAGYEEVGMDHFALPGDELFEARRSGGLHRNFMGYTPRATSLLIGLGASSISDTGSALAQNERTVEAYSSAVSEGRWAICSGHLLSEADQVIRRHILRLMTAYATSWEDRPGDGRYLAPALERLAECREDGLVETGPRHIRVLKHGRPFIRVICMALDEYAWNRRPGERIFSRSI